VGKQRKYDFAGWVTKHDIRCSDGVTIKHNAFRDNDGQKVPLVWNHDYNSPTNVLGHVLLQNQEQGVYGYGYFNDSKEAQDAKELVQHGDISSMSIGARKLKRSGTDVIHGNIYEVSLVLAGANPGAMIESVMQHSDDGDEERATIYTGTLIHSADDVLDNDVDQDDDEDEDIDIDELLDGLDDDEKEAVLAILEEYSDEEDDDSDEEEDDSDEEDDDSDEEDSDEDSVQHSDKGMVTIGEVIDTMTDQQKEAVYALLGMVTEDNINHNDEGDGETMKHNVFNKGSKENNDVLKHSINEVLKQASITKASSLKDMLAAAEVKNTQGEVLQHGINSIEMLFPEAAQSTNGNTPILYKDPNTAYAVILDGLNKSPFSRVKTTVADLTEDEARAKGYIKGNMKKEEFFSLIKRQTGPTTVYKKQKLDRDDVIDITDFDVVAFMNVEMQIMLKEEIARAVLVGDGRDFSAEDKINEQNIRPIISDNEFFTVHKNVAADGSDFIEVVIRAMGDYRGSGMPTMFIDPTLLATIKLLKGTDGRFLFGDIPSNAAIAARLGVDSVVPTTFMDGKGALIVNLRDYTLGATKGGQVTNFDDFDIDFNQYKYLIETRLSGALTMPKSAIHLAVGAAPLVGATDAAGGMTYGTRQADKVVTP
jgi:HK97 family phage prohead protease